MNQLTNNTAETVKKLAETIDEYYIKKKNAHLLSKRIIDFLGSKEWERFKLTGNLSYLVTRLNSIILQTVDDGHFQIQLQNSFNGIRLNKSSISRFTPHYIQIDNFARLSDESNRAQIIKVFSQVQDPLIIDLRDCPGGDPETAYFILSHLFANGIPLFEIETRTTTSRIFKSVSEFPFYTTFNKIKKFTGQIRLLINGNTASAAEIVAFVIKNKKRGLLYGSHTSTNAHIVYVHNIDNLTAYIPFAKTVDPETKEDWEGVGISPDYDVTSKEYIKLLYSEVALNYFTPA